MEKATLKQARKKVQSKVNKICHFLKTQRATSFTTPLKVSPNEDAGDDNADDNSDDQYDTP